MQIPKLLFLKYLRRLYNVFQNPSLDLSLKKLNIEWSHPQA